MVLSFLMWMNRLQDIKDVPEAVPSAWIGTNTWKNTGTRHVFEAESTQLIQQCESQPSAYVQFPVLLYGAHEVWVDNRLLVQFGDPNMQHANFVVSAPVIDCDSLHGGHLLRWRATAYSKYYAHLHGYPVLSAKAPLTRLFGETFYIGSSLGLMVLALFSLVVLYRKESNQLMLALSAAMAFNAIYQLMLVAPAFAIEIPMQTAHRIGDFSLGIGFTSVIVCFWLEKLIPGRLLLVHGLLALLSLPCWLFGTTGDTIQMGTTILMPTVLVGFIIATYRLLVTLRRDLNLESAFIFLFSLIFVGTTANDIQVFTGSTDGYTLTSLGLLTAFLVLLWAVNRRIHATYLERDYLRTNLEKEVERKTLALKQTQAELIQSAKLASLGTLSAGIAHEINNSINFVSGAIGPLEKLLNKLATVSEPDFEMGRKLLSAMKDGMKITLEIVRSLRNYTGLNQAKLKDLDVAQVIQSVTTLLHSKLKNEFQVVVDVPPGMTVYGDVVGINQILMNLIVNAMDAMPQGGEIKISARHHDAVSVIEVADKGSGIPDEIKTNIFDPFFTTKEVGSGTGLGLYIVVNEMKKCNGKVEVWSKVGEGTKFTLTFPDGVLAGSSSSAPAA